MRYYFLILISLILAASASGMSFGGIDQTSKSVIADTSETEKEDSTSSAIILLPDTDPYNIYSTPYQDRREYFTSGLFFGKYGLGFEGIYRPEQSSIYAGLVALSTWSSVIKEGNSSPGIFTGATVGYHLPFGVSHPRYRIHGEPETFHFYVRAGPGLGIASTRRFTSGTRSEREREIGVFLSGSGGFIVPFSQRSQFYLEAGWRGFWFPGADDLNFIGGPTLTFGFTFSFGGGIDPVRF